MKFTIEEANILEIKFEQFELFYPLFNSGDKVLFFKEKEDRFLLLAFIDVPILCEVLKEDIITRANLPDLYPETVDKAIDEWRTSHLIGQAPKMFALPFEKYGGIE